MSKDYLLGLYEKAMPNSLALKEKLLAAKNNGFDFVELSIDETDEKLARLDMSDEEIAQIVRIMSESKIYFRTICLSGHRRFPLGATAIENRQKGLEIMRKAIDLSYKLGVRIIQIAGYDTYYDEKSPQNQEYFAQNLKRCVLMAAAKGVILAFETMETDFMNTVEKAMSYVRDNNSPYLQVYPDIGNLTNAAVLYGKDVVEDIKCGSGHIAAAHLKETVPNVFRNMDFGTGHTDYVSCLRELLNQGVRTFVGEFWYLGGDNYENKLLSSSKFLRDKIDKALLLNQEN